MNDQIAIVTTEKPGSTFLMAPIIPQLSEIAAIKAMSEIAAYSGFLTSTSSNAVNRAADAFFVMMYGKEIGIPPMTALKTIYVIDGKPTCSAQAMLSLVRRSGCEVRLPDIGRIENEATVQIKRPAGEWKPYTYTTGMATDAGLMGKSNWKKYPREMLLWRAVSTAIRFEASDFVSGLYTIEEINPDLDVNAEGDPISAMAAPNEGINPAPPPEKKNGATQAATDPLDQFLLWTDSPIKKEEIGKLLTEHGLASTEDFKRIIQTLKPPESATWSKFSDAAEARMSFEDAKARIVELATRPAGPKNPLKNNGQPQQTDAPKQQKPPAGKKMSDAEIVRLQDAIWAALGTAPAEL